MCIYVYARVYIYVYVNTFIYNDRKSIFKLLYYFYKVKSIFILK